MSPAPVIACLHHLEHAFLGHAGVPLRAAGAELDERRLRYGDPLPDPGEVDGIVSFGGEQSVLDLAGDPVLSAEVELLRRAVADGVPVLGVCLGAQLLAHALGGSVARLPRRKVHWPPLEPLPAAAGDPLLGALPPGARALHWNEDGFEPPPGAVELLRRHGPSGQAFRFGECAWGVQFHAEIDEPELEGWYRDWGAALAEAGVDKAQARLADARHMRGQAALSEALFGGFGRVVAARAAARGAPVRVP